jgi:hypothetical protein
MKNLCGFSLVPLFLSIVLTGCSPSFQGIRMRIQNPPVEESFRKISLALTTDGYVLSKVDPAAHHVETEWRDIKAKEMSEQDTLQVSLSAGSGAGKIQTRILVRLEQRGRQFDLYLTPLLRYPGGDAWEEKIADVQHPLRKKWEQVLTRLLEKEAKEED